MAAAPRPPPDSVSDAVEQQLHRDFDLLHMRDGELLHTLVQQNQQILQRLDGLADGACRLTFRQD